MMLQTLPEVDVQGFDIPRINEYIRSNALNVICYFNHLVNVDYQDLKIPTITEINQINNDFDKHDKVSNIQTILIRLEDLKTLLTLLVNERTKVKAQIKK